MNKIFNILTGAKTYRDPKVKRTKLNILICEADGHVIGDKECTKRELDKYVIDIFNSNPTALSLNVIMLNGKTKVITR